MKILVTGGAGYIGSAAAKALVDEGHKIVVVDNLSNGVRDLVPEQAVFYEMDLTQKEKLKKVFEDHKFDAILHFAAYKAVGESMRNPVKYNDNIVGTCNLAEFAEEFKVKKVVYSSSAAVYGIPEKMPVTEDTPTDPINYYGYTKLTGEKILMWFAQIHDFSCVSLRYFNVAGDAGLNYIDPNAKNILPILMEVIFGQREKLVIFGDDYPTRDGTCIRDYIDLKDLVRAHVLALDSDENHIVNLGTSKGVSVKELVELTEEVTGEKIPREMGPRRPGDPAVLVASKQKAKKVLGWEPEVDIRDTIRGIFKAYKEST